MPHEIHNPLGGWKKVPGKPGEYVPAKYVAPVFTKDFSDFAAQSRTRWDIEVYLKELIKQYFQKSTSAKK